MSREFEEMGGQPLDFDPFAAGELERTATVTPEQKELWLSIQLGGTPASLAYNEAIALHLRGPLDRARLRKALDALVERHEALRTTLSSDGSKLKIRAHGSMAQTETDLSNRDPEARAREIAQARRQATEEPFDLVRGPLVRSRLLKFDQEHHLLLLTVHHLICDGWSLALLYNELGELYREASKPLPAPTPFSGYAGSRAAEQGSQQAARDLEYWRNLYKNPPPALELPLDRQRPPQRSFEAARVDRDLAPELFAALKAAAARHGTSLTALLCAAFQAYLQRITGQRSFALVMPAASQSIVGEPTLVGHCVRTLPLLANVDPKRAFHEHLLEVKSSLSDALDHPRITFSELVSELALARDPSRIPLSSVMFNVDANVTPPRFEGLEVRLEKLPRAHESFELSLNFALHREHATIETYFGAALFEPATIEQRVEEFVVLLEDVAQGPERAIGALALLTQSEKQTLASLNRTELALPAKTLCAAFHELARREPERPALRCGERRLSYGELDRASAAVARALCARGVGPGSFVGVFLSRSADLPLALLGVLRSGAAYVPLDPEFPSERLDFIARDAGLALVLCERALSARAPGSANCLILDELGDADGSTELDDSRLSSPAYVIYTSGSTGKPKGVIVEHRNVANFLASMRKRPGLTPSDVWLAITTPSFDISVLELFLPLAIGAEVVVATHEEVTDGLKLARLISKSGATVMQATPAGWRVLLDAGWQGQPGLKALTGGEALSNELATALLERTASVWNCYGPTETTVWSTIEHVQALPVSIGRPIDNTQVYVLDAELKPLPPGVVGDLFIAGEGVSAGYHDRPELNAERFLPDPFADRPGARMYKTGDLARLRWDGRLEWLGRSDFQVKVRGHRIELGEIEARLAECRGVREGVVIVREDRPGDQRIVAYVRSEAEAAPNEESIREELRQHLPSYMVPQHVMLLPALPLTPNGKVDRKSLPAPELGGQSKFRAPETELERLLVADYAELLGLERAGVDDDFFTLGGHSMLALQLTARIREHSGVEVPLRVVFSAPTPRELAEFVTTTLGGKHSSGVRSASALEDATALSGEEGAIP